MESTQCLWRELHSILEDQLHGLPENCIFFLNSLISQGRCHLDERELYDTDKTIPMTLCEEFYSVRRANDNNQISTFTVYVLRWSC